MGYNENMNKDNKLKNMKLLYVEDELLIQEEMTELFENFCDTIFLASNGDEGLESYKKEKPDIIFTDINMPNMDGLTFIQEVRKLNHKVNVVFLTAYSDEEKLIRALNLDVQGYILKSTLSYEKVENILEKIATNSFSKENTTVKIADNLHYDSLSSQLIFETLLIPLTNKEKKLMDLLVAHKSQVVSYELIDEEVWGNEFEYMSNTALRTVIRDLRKKIPMKFIFNVSKQGYKLL